MTRDGTDGRRWRRKGTVGEEKRGKNESLGMCNRIEVKKKKEVSEYKGYVRNWKKGKRKRRGKVRRKRRGIDDRVWERKNIGGRSYNNGREGKNEI